MRQAQESPSKGFVAPHISGIFFWALGSQQARAPQLSLGLFYSLQKRKSMGKIRGPNPKMKPTMQSKSVSAEWPRWGHPAPSSLQRVSQGHPHLLLEASCCLCCPSDPSQIWPRPLQSYAQSPDRSGFVPSQSTVSPCTHTRSLCGAACKVWGWTAGGQHPPSVEWEPP